MLVFEQFDQPGGMPADEQAPQGPPDPSAEITPLKKYYLSQRLIDLKNRLFRQGINLEELNLLIRFQNELSYTTLMSLADTLITKIENQLEKRKTSASSEES